MAAYAITLTIDGAIYRREPSPDETPIRIVILQRGWVMVGRWAQDGENCTLTDASVIRVWGTKKGLGEIAAGGPTNDTILDPAGTVRFHILAVVASLDCEEAKWSL